ncbi:MAG: T9SS type A sorting domain-containing protein, partial [Flavobacteriaceae bacterium]|nr:T9SS type A sorting domain-containing protein [Flavobacteriaceae bacterium]
GDVAAFSDGAQGYSIGDVDGNYILEFDPVDLTGYTGATLGIDYFINTTSYEGDGTENASGSDLIHIYVRDLTNGTEIDVINTLGINISVLTLGIWLNSTISLPDDITAQLVVKVRTNAGPETLYLDNIVIDGILSNNDVQSNAFSIYPNPANDYINITSQISGDKNVAIYDILGKQVINTITSERINISALTSGIYIVKITQNGVSSTKKLVVR